MVQQQGEQFFGPGRAPLGFDQLAAALQTELQRGEAADLADAVLRFRWSRVLGLIQPEPFQRLFESVFADRLQQIVGGIQLEGLHSVFPVSGDEDNFGLRCALLDCFGQFDAADFRHFDVQKNHIRLHFTSRCQRFVRIGELAGQLHARLFAEQALEIVQAEGFVVDDERTHAIFSFGFIFSVWFSVLFFLF